MSVDALNNPSASAGAGSVAGGADASIAELHERLDQLLIEYFTVYSSLRQYRSEANGLLKEGFFQLTNAQAESRNRIDSVAYEGRQINNTVNIETHWKQDGKDQHY